MKKEDPKPRFGVIAMSKGFITVDHLAEAMALQARGEPGGSEHRRIGEILVERGYMNACQVAEVLQEMVEAASRFECPKCGIMIYRCPNCNAELR